MAVDKKISQLTSLAQVNVDAAADVLPIVDTSAIETKKITVSALVGAGATAGISGAVLTSATITTSTVNSTSVGATTPSTGAFTTLSASSTTSLNPANANVSLAPTGTGTVTINPATAGTMNNVAIGGSTAAAGSFTTLTTSSTVTLSAGTANGVLYLNGSKVATSGSALVFDGTNLGIGTSSPAFALGSGVEVSRAGVATLRLSNTSGSNSVEIAADSTTNGIRFYGINNAPFVFSPNATERMRIDSSGNVGIGTSSPDAKLTVSGAASFADGTASAPGIANTGDLDTGMYFPAANEAAITTGGTVAAAFNSNGLFFRNRIINGDMRIDQRNAGASVTLSTTTQYPVDRFPSYKGTAGATVTAQQSSTAPTGFTNSIIYTVSTGATPAAGDINSFWQLIEGFNVADLGWGTASAQTVTLSFWVRSSVTGTYSVSFSNSANNRFYVATYTVNSANTYEYKTITVAGDTSGTWLTNNGIGIQITWDLGYGTNFNGTAGSWSGSTIRRTSGSVQLIATTGATLYITGVQLETGSVATPFERRPYGTELMLCQRYCVLIASGANKPIANSNYYTATTVAGYLSFPVDMRTTPTLSVVTGTSYYGNVANGGIDGLNSLTQDIRNERGITIYNNTEAAGTAGHGGYLACLDAAAKVLVTAEL